MHISVVTDDAEEFRYDADSAPVPGDRLVHEFTGYRVEERTWHVDSAKSEAWIELRVEVE
jgi:hypothetical protein